MKRQRRRWGLALGLVLAGLLPGGVVPAVENDRVSTPAPELSMEDLVFQTGEPADLDLSLEECLYLGIRYNADVRIEQYNAEISRNSVESEKGAFDPTVSLDVDWRESTQPPATFFDARSSENASLGLSWTQPLRTGGRYTATWSNFKGDSDISTFNPTYSSALTLSFTQPMLQNFGFRHTTRGITIARNNLAVSNAAFTLKVTATIRQIIDAYWELLFTRKSLEVQQDSLDLARKLFEDNKIRVEVGTMAPIEITQAEAGVASRREGIILARQAIRRAEDSLKQLMSIPLDSPLWAATLVPTSPPPLEEERIDMAAAVATALARRPELLQSEWNVRTRLLQAHAARNLVRPQLDYNFSITMSGLGGDVADAFVDTDFDGIPDTFVDGQEQNFDEAHRQVLDADFVSYTTGLSLSIPIFNRNARMTAANARVDLRKAELFRENQQRSIMVEVRNAVRDVQSGWERVEAARVNLRLQREKLRAEEIKFENGLSSSFEILEFQVDVTQAEEQELRAVLDYNKAVAAYHQAVGGLLAAWDIHVAPFEERHARPPVARQDRLDWLSPLDPPDPAPDRVNPAARRPAGR